AQTESSYARAIALKDIAQAQMRAGDRVSAKANFSQALNASREIDDIERRSKVLTEITDAQMTQFYDSEMAARNTSRIGKGRSVPQVFVKGPH
ncbi:MAG: hypothetical protein WAN46_17115, partial [Gammaproteobacteria bacterium]